MVFFEVCYSSVAHSPARWRKLLQTGPAVSMRRGGKRRRFLLNILYRSPPVAAGTKESASPGRVGIIQRRLPPVCPWLLCAFPSSAPSVGQVQSESLAELRLALILSPKAAAFI